jgi:prefoldin subunit 5
MGGEVYDFEVLDSAISVLRESINELESSIGENGEKILVIELARNYCTPTFQVLS